MPSPTLEVLSRPTKVLYAAPAAPLQEQKVESPQFKLDSPSKLMDLSLYEGQNPDDWLFRMEKFFFAKNRTSELEKL